MPPACRPLSLSHWAEAEAVSSFGASHRKGYEAVILPAVLSCRLQPRTASSVQGKAQTGRPKEKEKRLENKRMEKRNHIAVRGNKKHMKMKTTSMYVNICHLQQYDLQNKGDGFPAA